MTTPLIGEVRSFGRDAVPDGWRVCDGAELEIAAHQPLFSLLGWRFGGDGRTTFALPDLTTTGASVGVYAMAVSGLYPTREDLEQHATADGGLSYIAGMPPSHTTPPLNP